MKTQDISTKSLEEFTTRNGAPFPFQVVHVTDLEKWTPIERTIAICSGEYRVHADKNGETTADALRQIVKEKTSGKLTEWKPQPAKPKPETSERKV